MTCVAGSGGSGLLRFGRSDGHSAVNIARKTMALLE